MGSKLGQAITKSGTGKLPAQMQAAKAGATAQMQAAKAGARLAGQALGNAARKR